MSTTQQQGKTLKTSSKELENAIDKAIQKIGGGKENDICRYLPVTAGGYMHHFTLRKMKNEDPGQLCKMITKYIITVDAPKTVPPKPRAARGSRKRRDHLSFSKVDLEQMLRAARIAGDTDLIRKLTPKRDLRSLKRELIASIRHNRVEQDLWASYVEVVTNQNTTTTDADVTMISPFGAIPTATTTTQTT